MKKIFFFLAVALPCFIFTACGDDSDEPYDDSSNQITTESIVGTWEEYDDGDVDRLIFYSSGRGMRTYNGRTIWESGVGSNLGNFKWIHASGSHYQIIFNNSGDEFDVIWSGGNKLKFDHSIFTRK